MLRSDSDDVPLALHRRRGAMDKPPRSRSASPLPDWLSQNSSPAKALEILDDSDDAEGLEEPVEEEKDSKEVPVPSIAEDTEMAENGGKANGAKRGRTVLDDSSDSGGHAAHQPSARKRPKTAANGGEKAATPAKANKHGKLQQKGITAWLKKKEPSPAQPQKESAAAESPPEAPRASQKQALKSPQPKTGSQQAFKPLPDIVKGLAAVEGEVPIMMPAKLATNKVVVELQCGSEAEAVDLSGDAGVVGRWLVQGDDKDKPQLCMDLKGVLFFATTVPCASTLCVVNLTATEAKVEVLTSEVVQLRPEAAQGRGGEDDAQDDYFMYDDDDNYQYESGTQAKGKDDDDGPGAAGKGKKQKAGAAKKPAKKPGAKAVRKKPAGKAATGAKGRKKK